MSCWCLLAAGTDRNKRPSVLGRLAALLMFDWQAAAWLQQQTKRGAAAAEFTKRLSSFTLPVSLLLMVI